ncbi:hypothetical protein K8R42_00100 [bacterium]|nr:hypothetical protein [bacterium]
MDRDQDDKVGETGWIISGTNYMEEVYADGPKKGQATGVTAWKGRSWPRWNTRTHLVQNCYGAEWVPYDSIGSLMPRHRRLAIRIKRLFRFRGLLRSFSGALYTGV